MHLAFVTLQPHPPSALRCSKTKKPRGHMVCGAFRFSALPKPRVGPCWRLHWKSENAMIISLYAAVFVFLYLWLSVQVIRQRYRTHTALLDGGHPKLTRAIRAHANFA